MIVAFSLGGSFASQRVAFIIFLHRERMLRYILPVFRFLIITKQREQQVPFFVLGPCKSTICRDLLWIGILPALVFQAVKNLFSRTSNAAFEVLLQSTHDIAWAFGPFGEVFGTYSFAFLGSSLPLESGSPMDDCIPSPLPNEPCVTIDWSLPMTDSAQVILFQRILAHWNRSTANFPVAMKKKYRLSAEEVQDLRHRIVLFDQLLPHIKTRMAPEKVDEWLAEVSSSSKRDADLQQLLTSRPPRFAMSMLLSEQESAKKDLLDTEQKRIEDKEAQQAEVDAAQWSFFKGALKRDHGKVEQAQAAPRLVRQKLHQKQVQQRAKLATEGEHACKGYQDRLNFRGFDFAVLMLGSALSV